MSSSSDHKQSSKASHENGASADAELARARVAELLDDVTVGGDERSSKRSLGVRGTTGERDPDGKAALPTLSSSESNESNSSVVGDGATNEIGQGLGSHPTQVKLSAVKIKGRPGGVAIEINEGPWPELMGILAERLAAAEGFFRGGRVVLDVGPRLLREADLREMCKILEFHDMKLGVVCSTVERTLQAAHELGLSTSAEELGEPAEKADARQQGPLKSIHYVYRGNLRSGQILKRTESVVVIGDVNPGAQVISGGDIVIWGRLRGFAYAGAEGNRRAIVAALEFSPTQLRIAHLASVPPEQKRPSKGLWRWRKQSAKHPEVAYISEGRIMVEPWEDAKSSGPTILRR
jgi:septum site-determining protein MinC